jgi:hypothetical protein
MFVCWETCMISSRGLCDELITRPGESYRLWCVIVCDLETSWMRRSWPTGELLPQKQNKKNLYLCEMIVHIFNFRSLYRPNPKEMWMWTMWQYYITDLLVRWLCIGQCFHLRGCYSNFLTAPFSEVRFHMRQPATYQKLFKFWAFTYISDCDMIYVREKASSVV